GAGWSRNELVGIRPVGRWAGAWAVAAVATIVPAPGRSSTTTGLPPQRADRRSARMRATTSVGPPAANGTRILTVLAGKSAASSAATGEAAHAPSADARTQPASPPV